MYKYIRTLTSAFAVRGFFQSSYIENKKIKESKKQSNPFQYEIEGCDFMIILLIVFLFELVL